MRETPLFLQKKAAAFMRPFSAVLVTGERIGTQFRYPDSAE